MPPGRRMTAAYLRIVNDGTEAVVVDGVSASQGDASLHETVVVEGQSRMRAVDALSVPAGGDVALEPGGLHMMLMGLTSTPVEGEHLRLCIHSSDAVVCTDAVVSREAPPPAAPRADAGIDHEAQTHGQD